MQHRVDKFTQYCLDFVGLLSYFLILILIDWFMRKVGRIAVSSFIIITVIIVTVVIVVIVLIEYC